MNPRLDQERLEYLKTKLESSNTTARLSAWPRNNKELKSVEIDISWVRFFTGNHRTRAEQERVCHEMGKSNFFKDDPLSDDVQNKQFEILCEQDGFEDLLEDLKKRSQQDHAVITADGIIINGNRRVAALRKIYKKTGDQSASYVNCIVLPEDAERKEITQLETELQVARDFKEQYSWINRCLLVEELCKDNNLNYEVVANFMHRQAKDVRADYDRIQQVHQLIELSVNTLLHVNFESNESAFTELSSHIQNKPDNEKESVRSAYFLGILTGTNYRDLRHLRRADADMLVSEKIHEHSDLSGLIDLANIKDDSLDSDDVLDQALGPVTELPLSRRILNVLARCPKDGNLKFPDNTSIEARDALEQVKYAISDACLEASEQDKDKRVANAPIKRIEDATNNLRRAFSSLEKARATPDWDEKSYREKLNQAEEQLNLLKNGNLIDDSSRN